MYYIHCLMKKTRWRSRKGLKVLTAMLVGGTQRGPGVIECQTVIFYCALDAHTEHLHTQLDPSHKRTLQRLNPC